MGDVVSLNNYKNARDEEKRRVKNVLAVQTKIDNVGALIHNIDKCDNVSVVTTNYEYGVGVTGKENLLDVDTVEIIRDAIIAYKDKLSFNLSQLNIGSE